MQALPARNGRPRRILFFGTYDARRYPRVRVLQAGFSALGDDVSECNVPLGLDTADRVRMLRQPWRVPVLAWRLARAWWKLWRRARALATPDAVVVGYMGHFDVHLARRLWPETPIVLDHLVSASDTARDRGCDSSLIGALLARLDRAALAAADVPCVDTPDHLELVGDARDRTLVVPVGAPDEWFSTPRRSETKPLRVVFFGSFTPLQGAPVIGDAIRLLADDPNLQFTLIGRGQDYDATRALAAAHPNVTWIDWVDPDALPLVVASHDVSLGIFGTGAKALRVVPNKVFQGAAAGTAVVTSDTAPQRDALEGAATFVPPGDAAALADVLRSLARDPKRVWLLRRAAYARAEASFRPRAVIAPLAGGADIRLAA